MMEAVDGILGDGKGVSVHPVTEAASPKKGNKKVYWCEICQLSCKNDSNSISSHCGGSKHLKNASHQQILLKLSQEYDCFEQTPGTGSNSLRCLICNIVVTSPALMENHLKGSKHKSKMKDVAANGNANTGLPRSPLSSAMLSTRLQKCVLNAEPVSKKQKTVLPQPNNPTITLNEQKIIPPKSKNPINTLNEQKRIPPKSKNPINTLNGQKMVPPPPKKSTNTLKDSVLDTETPSKKHKVDPVQTQNSVSKLNELHPGLEYKMKSEGGPSHAPLFTVTVELNGQIFSGTGRSKKQAKQVAAEAALQSESAQQSLVQLGNTSKAAQPLRMNLSSKVNLNANVNNDKKIILDTVEFDALEDNFEDNFKGVHAATESADSETPSILSKHSLSWLTEKGLCSTATLEELSSQGLHALTHIQYISFPHLVNKVDCFLHARTGSGKTLAYLMPAIERLRAMEFKPNFGVGCLVVSPTRELALQIQRVLEPLAKAHNFTSITLIGGVKESRKDKAIISAGAVIVVATPGRLLDAVTRSPGEALPLSKCKIFIMDEADSILENSSQVQAVKKIYSYIPNDKLQKVLVSATVNDKSLKLANDILSADFKVLSTEKEKDSTSTDQIKQNYVLVSSGDRFSMLVTVLKTLNKKKTIVFFSSGQSVKFHYRLCQHLGLPVLHCYGRMKQGERSSTYEKFAQMPKGILLSTAMAERGWDIPGVQWIIQFDPPHNPQDYVHRVGRSGRGEGATGKALLFLSPQEHEFLSILKNMKVDIDKLEFQGNLQPIQEQIVMTVTTERELKKIAKTAFKKFVRAYQCHKFKKVFNVKKLDLDQVCKDFGFINPPMQLHLKTLK